jgi:hypothetical protein
MLYSKNSHILVAAVCMRLAQAVTLIAARKVTGQLEHSHSTCADRRTMSQCGMTAAHQVQYV